MSRRSSVLARLRAISGENGESRLEGTAGGVRYVVQKVPGALPGQPAWELVAEPLTAAA